MTWYGYSWDLCFWFRICCVTCWCWHVWQTKIQVFQLMVILIIIRDLPMDIVNKLSATSSWQNQSKIRIMSSLCILPQTRKRKENFFYVLYWMNKVNNFPRRLKSHIRWIASKLFVELNISICCLDKAIYYLLCIREQ